MLTTTSPSEVSCKLCLMGTNKSKERTRTFSRFEFFISNSSLSASNINTSVVPWMQGRKTMGPFGSQLNRKSGSQLNNVS